MTTLYAKYISSAQDKVFLGPMYFSLMTTSHNASAFSVLAMGTAPLHNSMHLIKPVDVVLLHSLKVA